MIRGVHGEKLVATLKSDKLPELDKERVEKAIKVYDKWVQDLREIDDLNVDMKIENLVKLLNEYKLYLDVDLIFDSPEDFLYRQKGQLKLDNTVIEEFLPIFIEKCFGEEIKKLNVEVTSQNKTFSSLHFTASLDNPLKGGGMVIKSKDQDFSISRKLFIKSSYSATFEDGDTLTQETNLGYVMAELKTNLDKTMFQEACATARDVKLAVTGSKYYLICDYLDMTPISTEITDIDEIIILRKTKRINSNIRSKFSSSNGRKSERDYYIKYLKDNPYSVDMFKRLAKHIQTIISDTTISEKTVLSNGFF